VAETLMKKLYNKNKELESDLENTDKAKTNVT